MDICQDEECPNYVIDEPNNCITFKQVRECPTPAYLNSNKEPVTEVPCSDGLSAKDINLIKGHYERCMRNAESTKDNPECATNAHIQWLEEADSYQKILLILESR